jgi:hypothetical protein
MKESIVFNETLIAPCGMNCGVCSSYLAYKHDAKTKGLKIPYCTGCRPRNKQCAFLKKKCNLLLEGRVKYCYECGNFPCRNLYHIDKRYQTLYRMSMIENLEYINKNSISQFLQKEVKKWECPNCGGIISCHNGICFNCGLDKLIKKKKLYRWEDS